MNNKAIASLRCWRSEPRLSSLQPTALARPILILATGGARGRGVLLAARTWCPGRAYTRRGDQRLRDDKAAGGRCGGAEVILCRDKPHGSRPVLLSSFTNGPSAELVVEYPEVRDGQHRAGGL